MRAKKVSMGKNKLKKFAEMSQLPNVFQCPASVMREKDEMSGNWRARYFHNDNPIVLELGCGRGEYTIGLAHLFADKNFIGVDIKGARQWAGATQAVQEGLANVAFLRTNIEFIHRFFAEGEIDEIWITFPDPQMKKATKRLTSTYFMRRYEQIMRPDGIIHLKTDSPFLYKYTEAMVSDNNLPMRYKTDDLYNQADLPFYLTNIKTHYENQWLDRGMTIKYISFALPRDIEWKEPDIEIEKDNYRSYGRNYVSSTNN